MQILPLFFLFLLLHNLCKLEKHKLSESHLNYNGKNNYIFLKIIQSYLEKLNDEFKDIFPNTYIKKYLGDINCKGMGEILILN